MILRIVLLGLLLAASGPTAAAQTAAPLRPDGNGVAALRRPVTLALADTALRDAVRDVAERAGLSVAFSGDLPGLDRRVSLRADALSGAAALLRLLQGSGLEVRVFPSGQLVLVRQPARDDAAVAPPAATFAGGPVPLPTVKLAEVVITPGRFGVESGAVASPMALSREDLETAPQLGDDVFRMMNRLPGVAAGEVSAKFAVRGGANEELLVLLDGLELVEPFHLKDFDGALSIVDGEALGGVDLTTGGFTAEHGDRLTGVFEMHTATPPTGRPVTEVGVSLSNARLLSQGAFDGGKGQWLVSARRGYLDFLLKLMQEDDDLRPRYGDALAKLQYQVARDHVLSVHALFAADRHFFRETDASVVARAGYHDLYAWANWRARFGDRVGARTILSVGDLSWNRDGERFDDSQLTVRVTDRRGFAFAGVEQQWTWEASDRFLAKWGWRAKTLDAAYDYDNFQRRRFVQDGQLRTRDDLTVVDESPSGRELGAYLSGRVRPWEALTLEAGLRFDEHTHSGDRAWSPRLNLAYALDGNTTLRAAWGIFHQSQGIHEIQVQDGDSAFYPAERAEHRIVSLERRFRGASLRIEAYQRVLDDVRPRWDNLERFIEPFPEVEDDRVLLRPESGDARGIELFAEGPRTGRVRWSASYALARIVDEYADGTAPRELDQRHTLHLGAGYLPSPRWRVSAAWQYHSGWPTTARDFQVTTLPDGRITVTNSFGPTYGDRLPAYHRLDARVTRSWHTRRGEVAAFLDAYNVYDRANPHGYDYTISVGPGSRLDVRRDGVSLLPFLPSFGVSWAF